jgi:hypothetical protein
MLIDDRFIWRTAHQFIEHYCDGAPSEATKHADASLAEGDVDGQRMWLRILAAIYDLRGSWPRNA